MCSHPLIISYLPLNKILKSLHGKDENTMFEAISPLRPLVPHLIDMAFALSLLVQKGIKDRLLCMPFSFLISSFVGWIELMHLKDIMKV